MTHENITSSIAVFNYAGTKLCDLYDSQQDLDGQAYDISFETNLQDGIKSLTFSIPYKIKSDKNFRWGFLRSEYQIRFIYDGKTEWYIAQKPVKHRDKNIIFGTVTCAGRETSLKTKNIYKEFDDENGVGTISYLVDQILAGTGWHRGHTDPLLEEDGITEKIRSITSGNKQGALGLMTTVCNIFKCYPVYKTDTYTVELYNFNNREQVIEGNIGYNLDSLTVNYNSSDIITRLYVEGEYEEDGYVGIDAANPTGLNYIFNFDYYKEIGVFTQEHETAYQTYLTDISGIKNEISAQTSRLLTAENALNTLIGQCKLVVYYRTTGFVTPRYVYGEMTNEQKTLTIGDEVVVMNNDGTYRYDTVETTASALIRSGDYAIAKFVTKAAGSVGANEVQVEAKEKEIANLQRKINTTSKQDKIAEYEAEITRLEADITNIYTKIDGLYMQMDSVMISNGLLYNYELMGIQLDELKVEQDNIEADFIIAMGDMLRDGYWNDKNYIAGQEAHLYADAVERLKILSRPDVSYSFSLVRLSEQFGIPIKDFKLNAIFRIHDEDLDVHENLFITKITIGVDDESVGSIAVSNKDITLNANDLGALLSRMSQLSDLIEQKNTLYERAKAVQKNGQIYTDRLNGQIDVLKTQLLSTVSNWRTDEQGNMIFEAVNGQSAMMLCGAGFMIANSKDDQDDWVWRTFGTGEGFTADEIIAGFISAERIEAGTISTDKVEPGFGGSLVLTGNPSIVDLNNMIAEDFIQNHPYHKGDMVNFDGVLYIFNEDFEGGTFQQALPYVSDTSVSTQIKLLPDKIVSIVQGQQYTRTYIQVTDPTLDPNLEVRTGDYWLRLCDGKTWNDVKEMTWQLTKESTWGELHGYNEMYCWDGTSWYPVTDHAAVAMAFTRITQTRDMILQEAERSQGKYLARTTQYQDANSIVTAAETYVDGQLTDYSTTEQTASMISTSISTALGNYYTKTETSSLVNTTISTSLGNYYTKTETSSLINTTISTKLGSYYTKTETDSKISTTISTALGSYYTKTETSSLINTTISTKLGSYYTKTETDSKISTTISSALGSYYTKTETSSLINTTISTKLGSYYTKTETDSKISTTISSALGSYYTKTETDSKISTTISTALGGYYTKSETSSQINTTISSALGGYYTKTETDSKISVAVAGPNGILSALNITQNGIDMSGSKYIKIKSGGEFKVESDSTFEVHSNNLDIDSSGLTIRSGTLKGTHYGVDGEPLLSRGDIIISSSQPAAAEGRIWIKPIDMATAEYRASVGSNANFWSGSSSRSLSYTLTGTAVTALSGTKTYMLQLPVYCNTTSASDMGISITLSNGTNSVSFTSTIPAAYYDTSSHVVSNWVLKLQTTNVNWLATTSSLTITITPTGSPSQFQLQNHGITGTATIIANMTSAGSSGVGWKECEVRAYQG